MIAPANIYSIVLPMLLLQLSNLAAQQSNADSLAMERRIAVAASDVPFPEGARALLVGRLQQGMNDEAEQIIRFMDRRVGYAPSPWLSPRERLLVTTLTSPLPLLRNTAALSTMLSRASNTPSALSPFSDNFHNRLRELLRQSAGDYLSLLQEQGATEVELRFAELLINWQTTRVYRARMELNNRVEAFVAQFPEQPLAAIAEENLITIYRASDFGGAFSAGYSIGRLSGKLAERFDIFWAPSLAGELNYGPLTLTGSLLIGVVEAPEDFVAGGNLWEKGEISLLTGELMAGYEIRFARLGFTPSVGLVYQSASGVRASESSDAPGTGFLQGWGAHLGIGYRIPSDVGPHFDFRARLGHIVSGLESYDSSLEGGISYLQIGFALVQRPWTD